VNHSGSGTSATAWTATTKPWPQYNPAQARFAHVGPYCRHELLTGQIEVENQECQVTRSRGPRTKSHSPRDPATYCGKHHTRQAAHSRSPSGDALTVAHFLGRGRETGLARAGYQWRRSQPSCSFLLRHGKIAHFRLRRHSGHGRSGCCFDPIANDPKRTIKLSGAVMG
jgi:hypothetical protein